MKFSKPFLDNLRNSISLADLIGEKVSWDKKKTKSSQGNFWAPCPFHEEKTASFHVDSNKGFYYCFGCMAKGDCFTFLKEYDRLSFSESVAYLASKSGIPLPTNSQITNEKYKTEETLLLIHAEATKFFKMQLKTTSAVGCRQYLKMREISGDAINHFEIGFASNSRDSLYKYLREKKFKTNDIISSGLCMIRDEEKKPFDRFRNRIMFPIKDDKNKIIAFGGRTLDASAPAKYLNSPETQLFSKGNVLYNYSNARMQTKSKTPLLVTEGYMDVIALFQAGFRKAVAPLGTAISEKQIQSLWRLDTEPVILFDGDSAGKNAAIKLLRLALPYLEPNKSFRFGRMPTNQDPDDLLKSEGKEGMTRIIENTQPAIQLLWTDLTDGYIFDSPERKANLELKLKQHIETIRNFQLKNHFKKAIKEISDQFFSYSNSNKKNENFSNTKNLNFRKKLAYSTPLKETKLSFLGSPSTKLNLELRLKEGIIVLGCLNHPVAAHTLENDLSRINFTFQDMKMIRDAILAEIPIKDGVTKENFLEKIKVRLKFDPLKKLRKIPQLTIHPFLKPEISTSVATQAISDVVNHHNSLINFQAEIKSAENDFASNESEIITSRIDNAKKMLQKALKGSETQNFIDNELTEASSKRLSAMIENKIWLKKK